MGMLLSSGSRQHPVSLPTCPRVWSFFGVSLSLGSIYLAPGTGSGVLGALLGAADLFGLPVMILPSFGSLVIYRVRCEEYEGPERSKPPVMRLPGAGDHRRGGKKTSFSKNGMTVLQPSPVMKRVAVVRRRDYPGFLPRVLALMNPWPCFEL
ncbi:hypothetical protein LX32DRAFT_634099, partial [Colletotrichum zoysiae]